MYLLEKIYFSFPFQLLITHFKKNQMILIIWIFLFGFINQLIGKSMGIHYLFLDAEYLNEVNFISFFIVGVSIGGFTMAYHITCFILDSYKFPFLGSVDKPMGKYFHNNAVIPVVFLFNYALNITTFQLNKGLQNYADITYDILGLCVGFTIIHLALFQYFKYTNKDIFKDIATNLENTLKQSNFNRLSIVRKHGFSKKFSIKVDNYFTFPFFNVKVNHGEPINKKLLTQIFDQNHLNASFLQLFAIVIIISMGLFSDFDIFQIPAAASVTLLVAMFTMFMGALTYWFREWSITFVILLLLCLNYFTKHNYITSTYEAFGINYTSKLADYSLANLNTLTSTQNYNSDSLATIKILNNWRNKFPAHKKPKMVFICTSGGGQRAASWTVNTLQTLDSATNNQLTEHTQIMSGASGGLIGASYYRELFLQQKQGKIKDATDRKYFVNITKDVLNPVIFSLVVNDIFLRYQTFNDGKYEHPKDRGYAFEKHMNENLEQIMQKPISAYKIPEQNAQIPLLLITPTITNDGRRLFISPQHMSYMCTSTPKIKTTLSQKIKGIEFIRFYKEQDAENLNFMSALRMSATFPYIMPNVHLPSTPAMEIMDAGIADNFGVNNAIKFMYVFKDWISQNTEGVVFVCLRDSEKELEIEKTPGMSIVEKAFNPIGNIFNSYDFLQDINNDNFVDFAHSWFNGKVEMVEFKYLPKAPKGTIVNHVENASSKERASLSWHLTNKEKESIRKTIYQDDNVLALKKLKKILE
jgi:hypothetical protein